jgi:FkbM family methyltransferase
MKILQIVLRNEFLAKKILSSIPAMYIREAFGKEFLSPIESFILDGYNEMLFANLGLSSADKAIIVGGYIGESASIVHSMYGVRIQILEPISEYANLLESKFSSVENIEVICAAAADFKGNIELSLDVEKTGVGANGVRVEVSAIDFAQFVRNNSQEIALVEMNIEGGEYAVLTHLISTGEIKKIRILLIQFHRYSLNEEFLRAQIRERLTLTHTLIFSYDWVWEKWERI